MKDKAMIHLATLAMTMVTATMFSTVASAAEVRVLHNFGGSPTDGFRPSGALIIDKDGNLYGETNVGGARGGDTDGGGTVFKLTRKEDGEWTETVLHSFGHGDGGNEPMGGLVFDAAGNLYGVTYFGGTYGRGTVFELSPAEDGKWTEKVLHSFGEELHGLAPDSALTFDSVGNLYGVTETGGTHNVGTVFELSPTEGGTWTEKVLHSFDAKIDGQFPQSALVFDAAGNLYGTAAFGGPNHSPQDVGGGTVFELTPEGDRWRETILYAFSGDNDSPGFSPNGVILDAVGNLYGTTAYGSLQGGGTIFELIRGEGGEWREKFLYDFHIPPGGGAWPYAGLILDNAGNLFGTTSAGGVHRAGEIFEFMPDGTGGWTHVVLHEFNSSDGSEPNDSLVMDAAGNLYGTTFFGGSHKEGTVFEVIR